MTAYRYEPAGEYHWSSNIAQPPSHEGVSDVRPMFAAEPSGRTGATDGL